MNKMQPNPHFLNRGVSLYVWNNLDDSADLANRLANAGYLTVLAPATALYFDMSHNANPEEPGVNWARYVDLQTVFNFDPLDITRESPFNLARTDGLQALTPFGQGHILGIQGTLFSETVTSQSVMDSLLMPRMLALAERAWSPPVLLDRQSAGALTASHAKVWSVFVNQVGKKVLPKLDQELKGVQYRLAPPGVSVRQGLIHVNHELPGVQIRYTTDGSVPVASSLLLNGSLKHSEFLKLAAFTANGRSSRVVQVAAP
jgi:hexosaminidase